MKRINWVETLSHRLPDTTLSISWLLVKIGLLFSATAAAMTRAASRRRWQYFSPAGNDAEVKMVAMNRREMLGVLAAGAAWFSCGGGAYAAPTEKRFVFVILRGAMDGLTAVPAARRPQLSCGARCDSDGG